VVEGYVGVMCIQFVQVRWEIDRESWGKGHCCDVTIFNLEKYSI
jgi:hypothetical protein